ncbi:FAD/NAD(P)-binding protein [uncultured Maribacter sp.]|uniref:FAD/NAD(P)-binding protein n=1 Tax=uncultured Maribacter sp. TaxID=431308 RepID=UPI00260A0D48|nr:FAD/NAD(P)-binding protein [uncultured Maribacter sp.]
MNYDTIYKIGIIGFGPKGFYGFERLIAYLNEAEISKSIEVHIFNNTSFLASGDVYRTDQPEYLIMNYANRNINSWVLKEPFSIASSTPDFVTWLTAKCHTNAAPGKYAPRALVGSYLVDCYQLVLEQLPKNVKVFTHIGKVADMIKQNENYQVFYTDRKSGKQDVVACNNALFTTGHHSFKNHKPESEILDNKIDFIYPTNEKLSPVTPQSLVAIKGFGLTAIDSILALTEGRGGTFKKNDKGILKYIPSKKEPYKIYPFSRTGLPMVPRNGSPTSEITLQYFTEEVVQNLKANKPISFNNTLLPLIQKEFYYAFYYVLFKVRGHQFYYDDDFTVMENQVQYFHEDYPESPVFNWETIINPFKDEPILSTVVLQVYIEFLIDEAKLGEDKSPFMAAVATWRKISPIFNELYSFGGLDAESHKEFDTFYFGLFNRLSYGPPIKNMQKMLALCKAGILDFSYAKSASITQNSENDNFTLLLENGQVSEIEYYINATISRAKEGGFENELFQNLKKNGLIRAFKNSCKFNYIPGCLEINDKGNPVSETGMVNNDITFYGTPTEGITCDNDTLSRTRNDFATVWAKETCTAILKRDGRTENYDRTENVL